MIAETNKHGTQDNSGLNLARSVLLFLMVSLLVLWLVNLPEYVKRITTLTIDTFSQAGEVVTSSALVQAEAASSGLSLSGYALYQISKIALLTFGFWFVALLVLWRAENRWFGWLTALLLAGLGALSLSEVLNITQPPQPVLVALSLISWIIWPIVLVWLFVFPDGSLVPRWAWWLTLILMTISACLTIIGFLAAWGVLPPDLSNIQSFVAPFLALAMILLALYAQVFRYRHVYLSAERQQVKWLVLGMAVLLVEVVSFAALPSYRPSFYVEDLLSAGLLVIPISIGIAILRYRLFDIDVIIRRTTSYAILTSLLLLVYFGSIVILQRLLSPITGESTIAVVLSTLFIAALFVPLRRRVQATIDRRFFRRKYDAEQVLAQFAATVRDETDLDALTAELVRVIQETMQPESVSVWLNPDASPTAEPKEGAHVR